MNLGDLFNYDKGQERTKALNSWLNENLDYYLGPTGIPDKVRSLNSLLNPIDQLREAGGQTVVAFDPERSKDERLGAAINAGVNTLTAAAPAIGGAIAGQPARQAVMETLANVTGPMDDAATRFIADEAGSVPLYGGGVSDPVAQRGDEILGLLSSGRANEVTDAMLDLGDPVANTRLNQYLFNNYDLPMGEASRMARAGEMGFDTDVFHGGAFDVQSFDPNRAGEVKYSDWGAGVYVGDTPSTADYYASEAVRKYDPDYQASFDRFQKTQSSEDLERFREAGRRIDREEGGTVFPLTTRNSEMLQYMPGDVTDPFLYEKSLAGGKRGAVILNRAGRGMDEAVTTPENLRSRFARFDPRLAHLSNLNASLGGLTLGGLLGLQGYQDDTALREYLKQQ